MEKSKGWLIYEIIVFYCFLSSANATMTLGANAYIELCLSAISLIVIPRDSFIHTPNRVFAAFFLAVAAMYTMKDSTISGIIAQFALVFIPLQLIFLKKEFQIRLFNICSNWFAILLSVSVIWWLLWIVGIPLPHISEELPWENNDYGFINENYILFRNVIDLNPYIATTSFHRFCGFFLEPGHIGTVCSIFLYTNKFDLNRWRNRIFLIVIILSFSAAAYVLTIIGYCFYRFTIDRWKVVLPILLIGLGIYLVSWFNAGENELNNIVLSKFTRDSGAIEGRFSLETQYIWDEVVNSNDIYFGRGAIELHQSAGYKVFLIMNGLLGALLVLVAYWIIQSINYTKLGSMLFLLMVISFLQRVYCFWDAFLDPYILGTAYISCKSTVTTCIKNNSPKH